MRRYLAGLALILFAVCARAELGPIVLYSRLGEPLRAEVAITRPEAIDFMHWRVGLADRAAFDNLNVVYLPELADLRFSLRAGPRGPVVLIRSQKPIRTPYLQFVLALKTTGGQWVSAYDLKLESRGEGDVVDVPVETTPAANAAPAMPQRLKVGKQDSLASLAARVRPKGVAPEQAMAALYQANKRQFLPGTPPVPRSGSELQVPSAAAMRALTLARARAILHPQTQVAAPRNIRPAVPLSEPLPPPDKIAVPPTAAAHAAPAPAPAPAGAAAHPATEAHPAPPPPLAASQIAAYAASEAAAHAKIDTLQQQVQQRAEALKKANQHIDQLNKQIKSLQASEAATANLLAKGFNYRNPLNLAMAAGAVALIAVLFFLLGRRRSANGKKKAPKSPGKHPLATTGVAQPDPAAAEASGHGDPLAEAEVYLAYGHDDQAEDILRKALDQHPGRQDLRSKLLEIYAARPDKVKFEVLAREVHDAYDGRGALWERTRAMGAAIDPENPLYLPENPAAVAAAAATPMMDFSALETPVGSEESEMLPVSPAEPPLALPETELPAEGQVETPAAENSDGNSLLDFDFSLENNASLPSAEPALDIEPDLSMLNDPEPVAEEPVIEMPPVADPVPAAPVEEAVAGTASAPAVSGAGEVLVEDISLPPSKDEEALSTKLDLAQVYIDMGDNEGAREVLNELIREAGGKLKQRAEDMLAQVA
ncbi:FimV/HubP family polar landmark protein [Paludibacterium sp. B53371]|uniref:FimV/HubP family polar landmark protein n=1 Tax=Paludibacterium sp. B53371 TaxID=2806263 RepID=UPI001C057E1E|nr:FimV/HubP family polar landmark protein [Paludibacterium sp. B53371]